jgi:hypothetical protein
MTMAEKIEAYIEGYRRIPTDDPESRALEGAWLKDLDSVDEDLPEAPDEGIGDEPGRGG